MKNLPLLLSTLAAAGACAPIDARPAQHNAPIVVAPPEPDPGEPPPEPEPEPAPAPARVPDRAYEVDMRAGREGKVPVSWFWTTTLAPTVAHRMRFRTRGCAGLSDTGMMVTWSEGGRTYTAFDDNGAVGDGNGRCSDIDTGYHAGAVTYAVYVFSMARGTSRATFEWSTDGGLTWPQRYTDNFGGTLVRVGAMSAGDYVQVLTPTDGVGDESTRIALFEAPAAGTGRVERAVLTHDGAIVGDRDPRVTTATAYPSASTVALVGKRTRSTASLRGVEVSVDLVRGPLDHGVASAALSCVGATCTGAPVVLPRGRHQVSIVARTSRPLGDVVAGQENYADAMGAVVDEGNNNFGRCGHIARGEGNTLALRVVLKASGAPVATRVVPRGLLGGDLTTPSRITFDVEADGVTPYSVDVDRLAPDVTLDSSWHRARNPDTAQLRVASYNFAYWAADGDEGVRTAILQNAADLLGTRGDLRPASLEVVELANQGRWQWEADVIAFQEFYRTTAQHVADRLRARTSYGWNYANSMTENNLTHTFYGPVFVNERTTPRTSIAYARAQLDDGSSARRCDRRGDDTADLYSSCFLGETDLTWYNQRNYAVPVRVRAPRAIGANAASDTPVALFNWHLFHERHLPSARAQNVQYLIDSVRYLMSRPADGASPAGACAFNRACVDDAMHPRNRILIVGDSNMENHRCGEFTGALRALRAAFGYAIDASAATVDPQGRTFDMHYSGASLLDARAGTFGDCNDPAWASSLRRGASATGCPFQWASDQVFNAAPPSPITANTWFPWWAATFADADAVSHGKERFDAVFLVGRGWADDDPVAAYEVMPHRQESSPMGQGGVELSYNYGSCDGRVANVTENYRPNVAVGICSATSGAPALRSDHIPVSVRLRVGNH